MLRWHQCFSVFLAVACLAEMIWPIEAQTLHAVWLSLGEKIKTRKERDREGRRSKEYREFPETSEILWL